MGQDSYLPLEKSGQSVIDQNLPYRFLRGQPLNHNDDNYSACRLNDWKLLKIKVKIAANMASDLNSLRAGISLERGCVTRLDWKSRTVVPLTGLITLYWSKQFGSMPVLEEAKTMVYVTNHNMITMAMVIFQNIQNGGQGRGKSIDRNSRLFLFHRAF